MLNFIITFNLLCIHIDCCRRWLSYHHQKPRMIRTIIQSKKLSWMCNVITPIRQNYFSSSLTMPQKNVKIGIHLGFREGELDNIQGAPLLLQEAPVSWLCKMRFQWLEWAPQDNRGSTNYVNLNSLKAALHKTGIEIKSTLQDHKL